MGLFDDDYKWNGGDPSDMSTYEPSGSGSIIPAVASLPCWIETFMWLSGGQTPSFSTINLAILAMSFNIQK